MNELNDEIDVRMTRRQASALIHEIGEICSVAINRERAQILQNVRTRLVTALTRPLNEGNAL